MASRLLAQHTLSIYPNPVSQTLHVQTSLTGELLYQVFDQSGRLVLAENGFNNQISVQQLSAGFYILKVNELTTGNVLVEKFIKEK
ncbi:MAG: T9SS type A sorting domain-containing protein [Chitinophagaceae bacterium]